MTSKAPTPQPAGKPAPIGGAVTQWGLPATPQDNDLRTMDAQSPHATAGLALKWDTTTDTLDYVIPAGQRDVSAFQAVSFRISQKVGSASNTANQAQDLRLTLTDGGGHSRAIRISKLQEIPYPYQRGKTQFIKSAMCTIRIPLGAYHIHCLNVDQVDLTDVTTLSFQFAEKSTGEIEIDSYSSRTEVRHEIRGDHPGERAEAERQGGNQGSRPRRGATVGMFSSASASADGIFRSWRPSPSS